MTHNRIILGLTMLLGCGGLFLVCAPAQGDMVALQWTAPVENSNCGMVSIEEADSIFFGILDSAGQWADFYRCSWLPGVRDTVLIPAPSQDTTVLLIVVRKIAGYNKYRHGTCNDGAYETIDTYTPSYVYSDTARFEYAQFSDSPPCGPNDVDLRRVD